MRKEKVGAIAIRSFALLVALGMTHQARSQDAATPYPAMAPIKQYLMDGTAEIALARSAAPESISRDAEVMVLGRRGYETAIKGKNEFEKSHFAAISEGTIKDYRAYLKHMKAFFGGFMLANITTKRVEEYRDHRRQQASIRYKGRTLKGATVNRELECLTCVLDLAVQRKYISENPARAVKHFNEMRERPQKQMLTLEQENRILDAAAPHLRVGIILLVQTGGRTYTEGFRLRWDQVDWEHRLIRFGNDVKTAGSSEPLPLSDLAYRVLKKWKEESQSDSPFIFPSPRKSGRPICSVKTAWNATLKRAGVPRFPIYNLRHAFCTRLSWVAPDAIVERAMRHTSPEAKRVYQLSMVEQVREAMERANQKVYGGSALIN
ncbi:MAG TPA: tyrosine-type recombinase/integrase [Candidatus Acidoferrum sp.]|jgi:integrase